MRRYEFVEKGLENLSKGVETTNAREILEWSLGEIYDMNAGIFGISKRRAIKIYNIYLSGILVGRTEERLTGVQTHKDSMNDLLNLKSRLYS
ncbi:hypothetical protein CMI38_03090 [Candidatus Pacearchaeota archaeon]|jgi:hypothetical protein|nr:hypothetical protein [Candidatus Pacearchaeota archaeon]|tara:strand:+ start:1747 stop:2022 length:276 start_codon:yes stop_codon:yes gene_type:complete